MNIVLTGSISQIGKPLVKKLIERNHHVTVISSKSERVNEIQSLGAKAAIGSMFDLNFLSETFKGADIVYLMETLDAAGSFFDQRVDFIAAVERIVLNYKKAIEEAGIKKVVHLSSIGADMEKDNGFLCFHHVAESILRQLSDDISIKFIRPVGFYSNLFPLINMIKTQGAIFYNYGGDQKEPWVSPLDIASAIAEEIDKPFEGRMIRYVASDEVSPNEIAKTLGSEIGILDLKWIIISNEKLLKNLLKAGFNPQIANGFVEMQTSQGNGLLYKDYYKNHPILGDVKLVDFAKEFSALFHQQ